MAFADESTLQMAENYAAGDEKLMVRFYLRPMKDDALSTKEGRPIFVDAEYIEIMVPGDKDNTINRPLRDEDKSRFRKLYENWSVTGKQAVIGTLGGTGIGEARFGHCGIARDHGQRFEFRVGGIESVERLRGCGRDGAEGGLG